MNIGIIFGGKSFEHDISIITAYQLKKKIEKIYTIKMIYCSIDGKLYDACNMEFNEYKVKSFKKLRRLNLNKMRLDIIVGALHGENGEDGLGCAFARLNNIKYLGCDVFSSSLCLDKYRSYLYLANNGIDMVKTILYSYEDYLNEKSIPFMPYIIKPIYGGSSIGIEICNNKDESIDKLSKAFSSTDLVVIQPFYKKIEEYNLALNETYYSNLERINKKDDFFSFDNKYSDSFKLMHQAIEKSEFYERFCCIARRVYNLIGASGIIRIDFFMIDEKIYVNEVNTTPGALSMYLFDDFLSVFNDSVGKVLIREDKEYFSNNFLAKNNINK